MLYKDRTEPLRLRVGTGWGKFLCGRDFRRRLGGGRGRGFEWRIGWDASSNENYIAFLEEEKKAIEEELKALNQTEEKKENKEEK